MSAIPTTFRSIPFAKLMKRYKAGSLPMSGYSWAEAEDVRMPFRLATVPGGIINRVFHLAVPESAELVMSEQNKGFRKSAPGFSPLGEAQFERIGELRHEAGRVLVVGGMKNHWHFLVNFLPRLQYAEQLLERSAYDRIMLHDNPSGFQAELLTRMGLDEITCHNPQGDDLVSFDEVHYPSMLHNVVLSADALARTREMIWKLVPETPSAFGDRLLLERAGDKPSRRFSNGEGVRQTLEAMDFTAIRNEDLSFDEQVNAYRSASVVVAGHGAGLSNMVFCRPGTDVLIFEYKWPSEMYGLARQLGLNPHVILCRQDIDETFEAENPGFSFRHRDLVVNMKQLHASLTGIFDRRQRA